MDYTWITKLLKTQKTFPKKIDEFLKSYNPLWSNSIIEDIIESTNEPYTENELVFFSKVFIKYPLDWNNSIKLLDIFDKGNRNQQFAILRVHHKNHILNSNGIVERVFNSDYKETFDDQIKIETMNYLISIKPDNIIPSCIPLISIYEFLEKNNNILEEFIKLIEILHQSMSSQSEQCIEWNLTAQVNKSMLEYIISSVLSSIDLNGRVLNRYLDLGPVLEFVIHGFQSLSSKEQVVLKDKIKKSLPYLIRYYYNDYYLDNYKGSSTFIKLGKIFPNISQMIFDHFKTLTSQPKVTLISCVNCIKILIGDYKSFDLIKKNISTITSAIGKSVLQLDGTKKSIALGLLNYLNKQFSNSMRFSDQQVEILIKHLINIDCTKTLPQFVELFQFLVNQSPSMFVKHHKELIKYWSTDEKFWFKWEELIDIVSVLVLQTLSTSNWDEFQSRFKLGEIICFETLYRLYVRDPKNKDLINTVQLAIQSKKWGHWSYNKGRMISLLYLFKQVGDESLNFGLKQAILELFSSSVDSDLRDLFDRTNTKESLFTLTHFKSFVNEFLDTDGVLHYFYKDIKSMDILCNIFIKEDTTLDTREYLIKCLINPIKEYIKKPNDSSETFRMYKVMFPMALKYSRYIDLDKEIIDIYQLAIKSELTNPIGLGKLLLGINNLESEIVNLFQMMININTSNTTLKLLFINTIHNGYHFDDKTTTQLNSIIQQLDDGIPFNLHHSSDDSSKPLSSSFVNMIEQFPNYLISKIIGMVAVSEGKSNYWKMMYKLSFVSSKFLNCVSLAAKSSTYPISKYGTYIPVYKRVLNWKSKYSIIQTSPNHLANVQFSFLPYQDYKSMVYNQLVTLTVISNFKIYPLQPMIGLRKVIFKNTQMFEVHWTRYIDNFPNIEEIVLDSVLNRVELFKISSLPNLKKLSIITRYFLDGNVKHVQNFEEFVKHMELKQIEFYINLLVCEPITLKEIPIYARCIKKFYMKCNYMKFNLSKVSFYNTHEYSNFSGLTTIKMETDSQNLSLPLKEFRSLKNLHLIGNTKNESLQHIEKFANLLNNSTITSFHFFQRADINNEFFVHPFVNIIDKHPTITSFIYKKDNFVVPQLFNFQFHTFENHSTNPQIFRFYKIR
ncbi:hypothetical protein DLAC_11549 [Tieghemostelium lacteum]|uniref:Uncharacterized protein n=1 Tax=Tieghemostelium lacteum TaxID=361077 RepID=A0A152A1S7_TIELA|nr:hypothetical protein DLAC_11549 [Tieghemostelium lacteum]|eukprot:KYR00198.1 hypothetical protein DLAC_11549 [Tieghemostelium lacteum]